MTGILRGVNKKVILGNLDISESRGGDGLWKAGEEESVYVRSVCICVFRRIRNVCVGGECEGSWDSTEKRPSQASRPLLGH